MATGKFKAYTCFSTAIWFLVLLLLILFAKMAAFEFYRVTSASMENTLLVNDFILIDKLTFGARTPNRVRLPLINKDLVLPSFKLPKLREIQPGDVVVFYKNIELSGHMMVKRCVAVSGQTVEIRNKKLYIDQKAADTLSVDGFDENLIVNLDSTFFPPDYIDPQTNPFGGNNRDNFGPLVVPDNSIFVLGDNRDFSLDSRYFGTVSVENVIGRAVLIYYSAAEDFTSGENQINWSRLGRFVK